MTRRRLALVAGLVLVAAGSAGSQPQRPLVFSWLLLPQAWVELDLGMEAGAEAVASYAATGGVVAWDVHMHPGGTPAGSPVSLERGAGQEGHVRWAPDTAGTYSYLWLNENSEGAVRLRVTLTLLGPARLLAIKP